jgi:hypothetical protein
MDQFALLHTVMRNQFLDSPESARRRENRATFEHEARQARRRRTRALVRRNLNGFGVFRREAAPMT